MPPVVDSSCLACGACQGECPADAIIAGDPYRIDADACSGCGACIDACPTASIYEPRPAHAAD